MAEPEMKKAKVDEPVKKALVTGITGQDGSYLAEFLLEKVPFRHFFRLFVSRFIYKQ